MHRSTLRLCSWHTFGPGPGLYGNHVQSLSTASATPLTTIKGQSNGGQKPGSRNAGKQRDSEATQDIIVDDLSATLEAHRARNRAAVIRKMEPSSGDTNKLFRRPLFERYGREDADAIHTTEQASVPRDTTMRHCEDQSRRDEKSEGYNPHKAENTSESPVKNKQPSRVWRWPADSVQAKALEARQGRRAFIRSIDPLEYSGMLPPVKGMWHRVVSTPAEFVRPWLLYMKNDSGDIYQSLSDEIKAFEAYMGLSSSEEAAAESVVSDFTTIIKDLLPSSSLTLLGSRSSGLATPTSDFDFSITLPSSQTVTAENGKALTARQQILASLRALREVEKRLRKTEQIIDIEMVTARVPLVSCRHRATRLNIQLQTLSPFHAAQQYTAAYLAELPSLRPLYVLIRHSLEMRGLTTVFEGGLGSYTILMMIVTALKHASGKFAPDNLAGQLLHVLDFYGNADLYTYGFSANPPRVFDKSKEKIWSLAERVARSKDPQLRGIDDIVQKSETRKPYLLCLQDPANPSNDLGRNAYAIKHIQVLFEKARERILKSPDKKRYFKVAGKWSALDALIQADYRAFEIHRQSIEHYALPNDKNRSQGDSDVTIKELLEKRSRDYKSDQEANESSVNLREVGNTPPVFDPLVKRNYPAYRKYPAHRKYPKVGDTNVGNTKWDDQRLSHQNLSTI